MDKDQKPQSDKLKEAARAAECDEDEGRWEERLRKVTKPRAGGSDGADGN
jgi:hypothetical protein